MNANRLKVEYPEHLNPFHSRRNGLTQSFRGIKKAIVRSFSGKDKERPTIRPKLVQGETRYAFSSVPPEYVEEPILLPRSRFSERVSKTYAPASPEVMANNPFENAVEGESKSKMNNSDDTTITTPPKPAKRTKLKRRKKRAPTAPESVDGSVNGSKWSLVSSESEMSSACYSESEIEHIDVEDITKKDEILKITQEIAKFTEDKNNNNIHNTGLDKKEISINDDTPDNVKSEDRLSSKEIEKSLNENTEVAEVSKQDNRIGENSQLVEVVAKSEVEQNDDKVILKENLHVTREVSQTIVMESSDSDRSVLKSHISEVYITVSDKSEDKPDSIIEKTETEANLNLVCQRPDSMNVVLHEALIHEPHKQEQINCDSVALSSTLDLEVKHKHSLIYKSHNNESNEDDAGKESALIEENISVLRSDNKEQTEATEGRLSVKGAIGLFESTYPSPTPKIRKNILTKENLLGSQEA